MSLSNRNGYIDCIKFIFALFILEFHLGSGLFPGGRVAVEGFFMISGYFMMGSIERHRDTQANIGISTVRFLSHKYFSLLSVLLPSSLLGYIVYSVIQDRTIAEFVHRLPLLLFDLIPLREAGFRGVYTVGISWYLSAMFLSLAFLYPLCKKFRSSFTLTICPILALLIYGFLSHSYGHLAIASMYIDGCFIGAGLLRGIAGCTSGCILYEAIRCLSQKRTTNAGRIIFTLAELLCFAFMLLVMHKKPKSNYDYVLVFVIFAMLLIGISGVSFSSCILKPQWTKKLGTASTLLVLNHYCWRDYLSKVYGADFAHTSSKWLYYAATVCSCVVVYLLSRVLKYLFSRINRVAFSDTNAASAKQGNQSK